MRTIRTRSFSKFNFIVLRVELDRVPFESGLRFCSHGYFLLTLDSSGGRCATMNHRPSGAWWFLQAVGQIVCGRIRLDPGCWQPNESGGDSLWMLRDSHRLCY